jgi:hypothetical protein
VRQRQHHRHDGVAERLEAMAEPGARVVPRGRVDPGTRFDEVGEEVALQVVGPVDDSPEEGEGADAHDQLRQGGELRAAPFAFAQRPEGEQRQRRQRQQGDRVHQVAGPEDEARPQRPPLQQEHRRQEGEGGGEELGPGEPGFVEEERRGGGEEDAEPGGAIAGELADQRPEGKQGGAGERRHRDPEGHEAGRVKRLPVEFGDPRRRSSAGEEDDRRRREARQGAAAGEVVGEEVGAAQLAVGARPVGGQLGDVEGDATVGPGAAL